MASNFGISVYRYKKTIQLELSGDFDGSSAFQVLSLMRNCLKETVKIVINTDYISHIDPLGLNIFRYNLGSLARYQKQFVFTGEKAFSFIETWPEKSLPEPKEKQESHYNYQDRPFEEHLFY